MKNTENANESMEAMQVKNMIISIQSRRIKILEDKLDEVRHRYFNLKKYVSLRGITNQYAK